MNENEVDCLTLLTSRPWFRGPPLRAVGGVDEMRGEGPFVRGLSVSLLGKRSPGDAACDAGALAHFADDAHANTIPILYDVGPSVDVERVAAPRGPTVHPTVPGGRRPTALSADDWRRVCDDFADASLLVAKQVSVLGIGCDDDDLLMATLSPRTNGGRSLSERLKQIQPIVDVVIDAAQKNARATVMFVCIDESCPGGLDITDGIEIIHFVADRGVTAVATSTGTRAFPALWNRRGFVAPADQHPSVRTAEYVRRRTTLPVFVQGRFDDAVRAHRVLQSHGFAGAIETSSLLGCERPRLF